MATDSSKEPVREFRLEGAGLMLIGGVLLAALVGAFFLGRWYERETTGPLAAQAAAAGDPLANVVRTVEEPPVDVDEGAGHFDRVEGAEQELEPDREAQRKASAAGTTKRAPASGSAVHAVAGGKFWVQVFAGRDERAAAGLVQQLESAGHPVKLHAVREGQGSLYKVRVGGFASMEQARQMVEQLQGEGYAGAWVTKVD